MRISDWSSDVCSSDLSGVATAANPNKVDVSQKGNGAESFVAQTGAILNEVEVDQDGNSYSMVLQDGGRNEAAVSQEGDDNQSFVRSEEHTSELQSLMRISYAVFCLKKKKTI